eukprot:GHVQ01006286.1.p1 GENE.GHVQ01006286.1~~GHVQ01006286.1.p1  ORF type:complete len:355 (+),score=115.64 GHVQ01006286.1:83-1147(+)
MGASESHEDIQEREARDLADLEASIPPSSINKYQDVSYPWFNIVQWSCESIPSNVVFRYNYHYIKEDVYSLTTSASPRTHTSSINRSSSSAVANSDALMDRPSFDFISNCPKCKIENFSLDEDDNTFVEWGGVLLAQIPSLARMRYRLVPSRLTEIEFWMRYFNAVRIIVHSQVLARETSDDDPSPPTTHPTSSLSSSSSSSSSSSPPSPSSSSSSSSASSSSSSSSSSSLLSPSSTASSATVCAGRPPILILSSPPSTVPTPVGGVMSTDTRCVLSSATAAVATADGLNECVMPCTVGGIVVGGRDEVCKGERGEEGKVAESNLPSVVGKCLAGGEGRGGEEREEDGVQMSGV